MTQTIHLIRHAEGTHNLSTDNHGMHDPGLTERGQEQARELAARIAKMKDDSGVEMGLVLASALRRTLMTGLAAFAPQLARKQPALLCAWPDVQEVSDLPCDSGSPLTAIQKEFGSGLVSFDMVENGWEEKVRLPVSRDRGWRQSFADFRANKKTERQIYQYRGGSGGQSASGTPMAKGATA